LIYAHKIIPIFFGPIPLVIYLYCLGIILNKGSIKTLAVIILALLSLPIFSNTLLSYMEKGLERPNIDNVRKADAVLVLGGMLHEYQSNHLASYEWDDPDRFIAGLDLMFAKKADTLIFTGGRLPWESERFSEGEELKKIAIKYGIPSVNIMVTSEVQNTSDEVRAVKKLFSNENKKKIILVTSAFHMKRALFLFKDSDLEIIPYPVDFKYYAGGMQINKFIPSAYALKDVEMAFREIMGRVYYLMLDSLRTY